MKAIVFWWILTCDCGGDSSAEGLPARATMQKLAERAWVYDQSAPHLGHDRPVSMALDEHVGPRLWRIVSSLAGSMTLTAVHFVGLTAHHVLLGCLESTILVWRETGKLRLQQLSGRKEAG